MRRKAGIGIIAFVALAVVWAGLQAAALRPAGQPGAAMPRGAVVIAQLSDTHLGLSQNPMTKAPLDPLEHLRRAVAMVNRRQVDAIVLSGDIGEDPSAWEDAKAALKAATAPVYWVPGNHDINSRNLERYRQAFGKDYYKFEVKGVEFYALDSQLLGNYDQFNATQPEPLPAETVAESHRMLKWLEQQAEAARQKPGVTRIAVQHIPASRGGDKVPDQKPYWITQEPYRSREIDLLRKLGVKDILAGHWHKPVVFEEHGFTHHVAPAVSWAVHPPIGFAVHTITPDGRVKTEFINLE